MVVQDPNFWKRFSTAVHNDDLAKEFNNGPDLKHSYVPFTSSSAPMPPTSQSHLSSPPQSMHNLSSSAFRLSVISCPAPAGLRKEERWQTELDTQRREKREMQEPQKQRPRRQPSKLKKSASRASTRPLLSHRRQSSSININFSTYPTSSLPTPQETNTLQRPPSILHSLRCPSSLSLSGRPRTVFKTWTTITGNAAANPQNSDSWLASQQRKKRQRTWICWCFWLGLIALVAGVVVAILVLRAHGILKI